MGAPRAPYMAKTDKERLATDFWNRIESNQATDCNKNLQAIHKREIDTQKKGGGSSVNFALESSDLLHTLW